MTTNLIIICLIAATKEVYTQFAADGILPDVRFGAANDRFDITSMIHDTNKIFNQQIARARENEEDELNDDNRRNMKSEEEGNGVLEYLSSDRVRKSGRRLDSDFAYHDKMNSNEGGTAQEYEQNLKHFMNAANLRASERSGRRMMEYVKHLHGSQETGRRTGGSNNEEDVLLHYAAPFVMEVDGYMKVPLH